MSKHFNYEDSKQKLIKIYDKNRKAEKSASSPLRKAAAASDIDTAEKMFIGLVIQGVKEFAPYLVESFTKGYGVKPNPFLSDLTGLIGGKLSDAAVVGSPPIEEIARACVAQIEFNASIYKGQEIPIDLAVRIVAHFDQQVKTMSASVIGLGQHSYAESIGTDFMHEVARIPDSAAGSASSSGPAMPPRDLFSERKEDSPDLSEQQQKEEAEARLKAERAEAQAKREAEEQRLAQERAEAEAQAKREAEERLAKEKAEAEAQAKREAEERLAKEKAEAQAKREAEERLAQERAEAEREAEEQHTEPLLVQHQEHSNVQLTHSPKPKPGSVYKSYTADGLNDVVINVGPSADITTPLLSHHTDDVNVIGGTASDSTDGSCCPCCSIM